jgi:PAS domain S-box-containing protein
MHDTDFKEIKMKITLIAVFIPLLGSMTAFLSSLPWPLLLQELTFLLMTCLVLFIFLGSCKYKLFLSSSSKIINTVIDTLTAKKSLEKDLQKQRDWLKITLSSIGDGIIATDKEATITFLNKEAERLTEWTEVEASGKNVNEIFKIINEVDGEKIDHPVKLILQLGTIKGIADHTLLITKSGKEVPIGNKFAPIQDEQGNILGIIIIFRDVSEIVGSKQELLAAQAQLVNSEKLAGLGRLAAGVAHEINNPLGYITSNLRTLAKYVAALKEAFNKYQSLIGKIGPIPSELQKEFDKKLVLDFIIGDIDEIVKENKEGIDKIVQIVGDLKSFTHTNPEATVKPADLNKAIKNTLTVARNEIKYLAEVTCELAELPEIPCILSEINQVLLNIIINAAQAIKSQKRQAKGHIRIVTSDSGDYVSCEISDDGPGILPANLGRIFDPFFTTKPPGEGTGLGLSISYDIIVNKHQGELLVESALDKGCKFIIKLPKKTAESFRS